MATPAAVYAIFAPFIAVAFIVAVRRLDPALRDVSRSDTAVTEPPLRAAANQGTFSIGSANLRL